MLLHDKSSGRHLQTIFLCLLPLVMMTGCIVIPVPTGEKPYYTGAIPNLEVGVTSKNEVLTEFGVPDVTYQHDSELIYIETQESWKVAWAGLAPNLQPAYSPTGLWPPEIFSGVGTLHKRFVLSLSFDTQDTLSAVELDTAGDDFGDCTSHGICLGKTNTVMRYADSITEAEAKGFKLSEDHCSIYLHGPGSRKAYEVSLNGKIPVSIFSTGAFVHWITKPGPQSLVIFPEPAYLDFDCRVGEIAFVHFDLIRPGPSRLRLESNATGRAHITNRHLVLLPTS
jgi:hypothetical protein